MRRILKLIFNRVFVIIFLILIQIASVIALINWLNDLFFPFKVFQIVLCVLAFFAIIDKTENPEFKIPWLILVIAFPLVGTPLFIMFGANKMPKRMQKRTLKILDETKEIIKITQDDTIKIKEISKNYYGDIKYIETSSSVNAHLNSKVEYFNSGENFLNQYLIDLSNAKKFIFIEYFIIAGCSSWSKIYDILLKKVREGVDVRILYDDFGSASKLPFHFQRDLIKNGIKCYRINEFVPIISGIYNNRNHRKITVIDGKIAYTGGVNLADEYFNITHPYGYWKDNAIKIQGKAVDNMTLLFLQIYSFCAKTTEDYEVFMNQYDLFENKGIVLPFGDGPRPAYNELIGENVYLNIINKAQNYVYITTPYLICDFSIINALCNASKRGVDVRIITPHIPDKKLAFSMTRSNYKHLMESGVKIYEFKPGFIHAKTFLSDDVVGVIGSINLDFRSLVHHYENAVWMYDCECLKDIKDDFLKTFDESILQDEKSAKMNPFTRLIVTAFKMFQALF